VCGRGGQAHGLAPEAGSDGGSRRQYRQGDRRVGRTGRLVDRGEEVLDVRGTGRATAWQQVGPGARKAASVKRSRASPYAAAETAGQEQHVVGSYEYTDMFNNNQRTTVGGN